MKIFKLTTGLLFLFAFFTVPALAQQDSSESFIAEYGKELCTSNNKGNIEAASKIVVNVPIALKGQPSGNALVAFYCQKNGSLVMYLDGKSSETGLLENLRIRTANICAFDKKNYYRGQVIRKTDYYDVLSDSKIPNFAIFCPLEPKLKDNF
jgi:hypothetical protein